eukprot:scaffold45621_cov56-Attheya_sp.AAC.3
MPPDAARGGGDRNNRSKSGRGGIHTLSNLNNYYSSDRYEDEHASSSSSSGAALFQIQHISDLPNADVAQALLRRINAEFFPIVQRRGWRVTSVTEMCCCDDGIHELGGKNNKRRRKKKSMPNNVWGYNQTHFSQRGKCHTIHLRLRQPGPSHALLPYEDVAGTMSHELAHCHVGPHNVKFYKLMDEIQEQHATLLITGLVKDTNGFPINSPTAYTLGTRDGTTVPNNNSADARSQALQAALDRTKQPKSRPRRLGGKKLGGGNALNPREAARIAAERRLADAPWCLPCEEIIELLNDDSDDEEICEKGQGQNPAKVLNSSSSSSSSRVT